MLVGFILAAWSVVANDSIQTLGTFLSSNKDVKWYYLYIISALVLITTLSLGWYINNGDIAWGRLDHIPQPETFNILHALAPLVLLILTKYGLPVSTTFLVLSVFASNAVMTGMIIQGLLGYSIAFFSAFFIWKAISYVLDEHLPIKDKNQKKYWRIGQWFATMFLWSQWLMHDVANITVYLPREISFIELLFTLFILCTFLGIIFYKKGGNIQKIVLEKSGTRFMRSATIIDIVFGLLLLFFKQIYALPISTTFVFVGLLAGRELAIYHLHSKNKHFKIIFPMLIKDFIKIMLGLAISIFIAVFVSNML